MNKPQKQIIFIELIIVGLVIWRYLDDSLSFNSALTYTLLYVICMFGWFYFRRKQHLYLFWFIVDGMHIYNLKLLKLVIYNRYIIRQIKTPRIWGYFKRISLFISFCSKCIPNTCRSRLVSILFISRFHFCSYLNQPKD